MVLLDDLNDATPRPHSLASLTPSFTWERITVRESPGESASCTFSPLTWFSEKYCAFPILPMSW